jgi:hypothetical protein
MNEVTELLESAWKRIEDPKNWCKKYFAMDSRNRHVSPYSKRACKFCAIGAIDARWRDNPLATHKAEVLLIAAAFNIGHGDPTYVNDCLGHDAVRRMYSLAIENSKVAA